MKKTDAFFEEFEVVFECPDSSLSSGARRSTRYPHVQAKLYPSEYHEDDVGVNIYSIVADEAFREQCLEEEVLEYLKESALRHGLVLAAFTLDQCERVRFSAAGFVQCEHRVLGRGGAQLEWPSCWHLDHPD